MDGGAIQRSDSAGKFCSIEIIKTGQIRQRDVITSVLFEDGPIERGCPANHETEEQSESQKITANGREWERIDWLFIRVHSRPFAVSFWFSEFHISSPCNS